MTLTKARIKKLAASAAQTGIDYNLTTDEPYFEEEGGSSGRSKVRWQQPDRTAIGVANRMLKLHLKQSTAEFIAANPGAFAGLKAKPAASALVVPVSAGRTREAYAAITTKILTKEGAQSTQVAIGKAISAARPDIKAPKDWGKTMPPWAVESLKKAVQQAGAPFDQIKVTAKTTLASLHRAAKLAVVSESAEGVRLAAEIVVAPDFVYINGRPFKISRATQRVIVPVAHLLDMLR